MTADTPPRSDPADTTPHGLNEGVEAALKAEDGGPAAPLLDWLARNPERAAELADFLAAQRGIRSTITIARPAPAAAGGYQILGELGRGGMGVVYRAYDPRLKREVALKQMPGGDEGRFRFEAEAAASLDHPHVVRVFDFGEDGGVPFLVMPVMEGGSLAAKLRGLGPDRCRPPREAAGLVRDVALGVHHAHQRGLLHRDLKPGNVLLDAAGRPHVADFGLARPLGASVSAAAGTAAYMAPEQARGDKGLTVAADVHALGAILFELLTGRPPFGTESVGVVVERVLNEPAPPVRRDRADCPADLEAVCARCLEKRPEDRYPSAAALADDLARFLDGEPVHARPRGLLGAVREEATRPPRPQPFRTIPGTVFAAVHHPLVNGLVAVLLYTGAPTGWAFAVVIYHLVSWGAQLVWFGVRRLPELRAVERQSLVVHAALWLAVVTLLPLHLAVFGADPLPFYPALNAVSAIGVLVFGVMFSTRLYAAGLAWFALNALLPFLPGWSWPLVHGLTGGVVFAGVALHQWRLDRAARPSD